MHSFFVPAMGNLPIFFSQHSNDEGCPGEGEGEGGGVEGAHGITEID